MLPFIHGLSELSQDKIYSGLLLALENSKTMYNKEKFKSYDKLVEIIRKYKCKYRSSRAKSPDSKPEMEWFIYMPFIPDLHKELIRHHLFTRFEIKPEGYSYCYDISGDTCIGEMIKQRHQNN